jgi:flagellar biosynthesis protein FlhF
MNIQRFLGPTSREAMAKARAAFGDSAVILSSRATAGGFEVVATTEENLSALPATATASQQAAQPKARTAQAALPRPDAESVRSLPKAPAPRSLEKTTVERDTETMAMSTLSFQDYVRERMLKRRKEEMETKAATAALADKAPVFSAARSGSAPPTARAEFGERVVTDLGRMSEAPAPRSVAPAAAPARRAQPADDWTSAIHVPGSIVTQEQPIAGPGISDEIHALKEMIEERFNMLAWLGTSRNNPMQSNLMLKLIRAGYSPALVRTVLERLPADGGPAEAVRWVLDVLARNIKTADSATAICDEGGVVSLMGATGVGKTTTAAKLAAQCVKTYGANSVGLITLDTYRVAGYEQLRAYGRMMGVVAHLAHDRAALKDMLNLLSGKRLVLIDTAGLGQKDPRIQDMLDVLDMPSIKKVLVLNASSHGDTMDDVLSTFKPKDLHGVVLSKVDEAVKLGPAVDALIRHQVTLLGVANGQRVPEDWQRPDAAALVRTSMGPAGKSAHDPAPSELGFYFAQPAQKQMNLGVLRV